MSSTEEVMRKGAINAFMKLVDEAHKKEETKNLGNIKVELGVNSYWGDKVSDVDGKKPHTYWFYVNVTRSGWGYYAEFGTDYDAAKLFYDSCNVFARLLGQHDEMREHFKDMEKQVWMQHAMAFHGKEVAMEGQH